MTLPAIDDISTLGGIKVNFQPVEDATTDLDAAQDNKARADVAMMTHTASRSWAKFVAAATTGAMVLSAHDAVWGNAPGLAPTLARTGTGVFTITWPASVNDELGVTHATSLRAASAVARGSVAYHAQTSITAANVVTVYVFDMSGAANDAVGVTLDVVAI